MRILGVDPGSRWLGYAVIETKPRAHAGKSPLFTLITQGTLAVGDGEHPDRLLKIFEGLNQVIEGYRPEVLSVERVFFAKNAASALKLGQARGVVLLMGGLHALRVDEFTPTQVKAAVSGSGKADKEQVDKAVQWWVGAQEFLRSDASDAVALALTSALGALGASHSRSNALLQPRSRKKLSIAESLGITDERFVLGKAKGSLK